MVSDDRLQHLRRSGAAGVVRLRAALDEAAAVEALVQRRHRAGDCRQPDAALGAIGQRAEEHPRVGMQRPREELLGLRNLDDLAGVHQRHALRHLRDDAEVVRDQQHRHAMAALQVGEQVEDLLLDRHVERGRRFVGDNDVGFAGERDRDHHALLLAP